MENARFFENKRNQFLFEQLKKTKRYGITKDEQMK